MTDYTKMIEKWDEDTENDFEFHLELFRLGVIDEICKWMHTKKVSKTRLAKGIGVSWKHIDDILGTKVDITIEELVKIAMFFNCRVDVFFIPMRKVGGK